MGSETKQADNIQDGSYEIQAKARNSESSRGWSGIAAAEQGRPWRNAQDVSSPQHWKDKAGGKLDTQHRKQRDPDAGTTDVPKTRCT